MTNNVMNHRLSFEIDFRSFTDISPAYESGELRWCDYQKDKIIIYTFISTSILIVRWLGKRQQR